MEEAVMCAPKTKKHKKKKQHESKLPSMDSVLEESCSSQDIQQIAQTAAETVFNDLLDKVAAFSLDLDTTKDISMTDLPHTTTESSVSVIEALDNARATFEEIATAIGMLSNENIENGEEDIIADEKLDENEIKVNSADVEAASPVNEIQLTPESKHDENECKLNAVNHDDDVVSEEPSYNDIKLVEQEMALSKKPIDHVITPQSRSSLPETDPKEDNPQPPILKPSVFVGRDKLYHSSLQLGCSWDRTKYNIVLLPDLKKVVYPDLDSLLSGKPVNTIGSLGDDLLMSSAKRRIDRSSKPMPVTVPAPAIVTRAPLHSIVKYHDVSKEIEQQSPLPPPAKVANVVKFDIPTTVKYKADVKDPKYTDFNLDGIDFRVFMNPVKWDPRDHHNQLVLFRVGPIFYEEFFTNCGTTDGFINVIKDRAEGLAKQQLHLAQECLLEEGGNTKLIDLQDATLVIYNFPPRTDKRTTTHKIRFGVNEGFYEEDFRDCKTVKDIVESVKRRAEIISTQQKLFKTKANFETKPDHDDISWGMLSESNSDVAQDIGNSTYDFGGKESPEIKQQSDHPPVPPEEIAGTSLESDQVHASSKFRRTMKSVRNWFKDTFTRKPSKRSKKSRGGNEVLWQWNDGSPASFSSSRMLDDAENVKE